MGSVSNQEFTGGCAKTEEEEAKTEEEDCQVFTGSGVCKWFNVRMGFGFLSMTNREGTPLEAPIDVFVHQSKLHMEGFRSLKEGEAVEFTFKKSAKGLESLRVMGPAGAFCVGSERRPKGKSIQKRRSKGDSGFKGSSVQAWKQTSIPEAGGQTGGVGNRRLQRCYNCGGLDHHAKECKLPPQPKKCHFCQSITHMVANCPIKAQQSSPSSQGKPASVKGGEEEQSQAPLLPESSE
ncbi:hypothetical protein AOXY_G25777 [Acipenser oxyrinchus oxyrinchus]|uniref:Protein lin-28 homolog A n=1 Tax=Acipenser oxyrinchus oxyrinchus TaxID=40147 RepID=A0AAD8FTJ8_ACIOX|nr:hypothetical protein AOXY_G25777 [Acipenser oxyrinchus oxyrinchus]